MKLRLHTFDLPLRHRFTIARGSLDVQPTLIVELEENGHHGYGEATTNSYYGATLESMTAALENVRGEIESYDLQDPAAFWEALHPRLRDNPFAHCALDQAAHDLWG
ncbi:MAG: dipeptide epimerase, partial [Planctomycetes bacterium]|nr:dipeptide epimerase [Planctomycetota bacterium]